jgi:hypothetical protein
MNLDYPALFWIIGIAAAGLLLIGGALGWMLH